MRGIPFECLLLLLLWWFSNMTFPWEAICCGKFYALRKTEKGKNGDCSHDFTLHDSAFIIFKYICIFFIPATPVIEIETIIYIQFNTSSFSQIFFFYQNVCHDHRVIICMNCLDFNEAFWNLTACFMHPSLQSVSALIFTSLPVCLSDGIKLMLHSVHIQT